MKTLTPLSKFVLQAKELRTAHLDLTTPCLVEEELGLSTRRSRGQASLLSLLGLSNDVPNWQKAKLQTCHAPGCPHNSRNGWCSNPFHLYFGSPTENELDKPSDQPFQFQRFSNLNKDELGRSVAAVLGGQAAFKAPWVCLESGVVLPVGPLGNYQKARGFSQRLKLTGEFAHLLRHLETFQLERKYRPTKTLKRLPAPVLEGLQAALLR